MTDEYRRGRREAMLACMKEQCVCCRNGTPVEWVEQISEWYHRFESGRGTVHCSADVIRKRFEREGFRDEG